MTAAVTRWSSSQPASASSPLGKALNTRVNISASVLRRARRTVAVTCILWTSSPAARGMDDVHRVDVCHGASSFGWVGEAEAETFGQPTHIPVWDAARFVVRPRTNREQGGVRSHRSGQFLQRARSTGKRASTCPLPPWNHCPLPAGEASRAAGWRPERLAHRASRSCYMPTGCARPRHDHERFCCTGRWQ